MKTILRISMILVVALTFLLSCNKGELIHKNKSDEINSLMILDKETALDDIILPVGSIISMVSESQIDIELPPNFEFLLFHEKDGVSYSNSGSYSCTCSAKNSCKVIYSESFGYGCLQNSCTGTCTGKPGGMDDNKIIYGVINTTYTDLVADNFSESGNLNKKGYEIFFNMVAKEKLIDFFDFAFSQNVYKNSTELIQHKGEQSITYVTLQYKGITFSAPVPNFDHVADKQLINFKTGLRVSCVGNNECRCIKDQYCLLGNCVYYCDGCKTCEMIVDN